MNKKILSNYFYSVLYQLLLVIIPLIITPYTTRVLGLTPLSINTSTANVIQWFALFGIMGINIYGNREIARVRDDKQALSRTFFEIVSMQFLSLLTMIVLLMIYIVTVGDAYPQILMIQGISLLGVALDITWFFYGVEDFKKVSLRNCFVKLAGVLLIFGFVNTSDDLVLFVSINVFMTVLGQAIMWFQLRSYIQFERINFQGITRHFKPNIKYFIPQLAISVYSIMDVTMIKTLGPVFEEVYLYEQTQRFIKMFLFFVTSIGTVMLPRLSNIFGKGDIKQVQTYLNKTFRISLYLAIPMIFGICAIIQGFIGWFLPEDFYIVGTLIQWGSPLILFISLSNVFGVQYLLPTGNTKQYTRSVVIGACVNFTLNFFLIPRYGVYGALFASLVGELCVTLYQWLVIRGDISVKMSLKEISIILTASILMVGMVVVISSLTNVGFISTLLQGVIGCITYAGLLFLLKAPILKEVRLLNK